MRNKPLYDVWAWSSTATTTTECCATRRSTAPLNAVRVVHAAAPRSPQTPNSAGSEVHVGAHVAGHGRFERLHGLLDLVRVGCGQLDLEADVQIARFGFALDAAAFEARDLPALR